MCGSVRCDARFGRRCGDRVGRQDGDRIGRQNGDRIGRQDGDPVGPLDGDRAAMMERPVWIAAEPRAALLRQMVPDREQYHQP